MFGSEPYVEHVAIVGDKRNYVSERPRRPVLPGAGAACPRERHPVRFVSREELVARREIIAFYGGRIQRINEGLAAFEQIKLFTLMPREFTQDGGELTPTLKIKRRFVEQKYRRPPPRDGARLSTWRGPVRTRAARRASGERASLTRRGERKAEARRDHA